MPTYEFRCPGGHDFEKFYRSISAAPTEVLCPTCGKVGARQLSAGGGLLFKGSGFYITDYGKDGKKSQAAVPTGGDSAKNGGDSAASKPESSRDAEKPGSGSDAKVSKAPETKSASRPDSGGTTPASGTSSKKPKASE
jgi:putative FmdB family regulatory protein